MKKVHLIIIFSLITTICFSQSIDSLKQIIAKKTKLDSTKILAILELADLYKKLNIDSTKILADEALVLSEKISFTKGKGKAKYWIGYYLQKKNQANEALDVYKQSIEISKQVNDLYNIADCYKNAGTLYYYLGNIDSSIYCYTNSLNIFIVYLILGLVT